MDVEECPAPKGSYSLSSLFVKPAGDLQHGRYMEWGCLYCQTSQMGKALHLMVEKAQRLLTS